MDKVTNKLNSGYLYKNKRIINLLSLIDKVLCLIIPKSQNRLPTGDIKNILLVKPDHLGDVVLMTGAIKKIKERYPDSKISVITGPWSKGILKKNPNIEHIFTIRHPLLNRLSTGHVKKLAFFIKDLFLYFSKNFHKNYDAVIFLRSFGGNLITLAPLIRSNLKIGHGTAGFSRLLHLSPAWKEGVHEVEHFNEVLFHIDVKIKLSNFSYDIHTTPQELRNVKEFIAKQMGSSPFICVHPGAGDPSKKLDFQDWLKILSSSKDVIVVTGIGQDKDLYDFLQSQKIKNKIVNATDIFSIPETYLLFKFSKYIYCLDSLAGHLAGASNTKTTVYFTKSSDELQWRPLGNNINILRIN